MAAFDSIGGIIEAVLGRNSRLEGRGLESMFSAAYLGDCSVCAISKSPTVGALRIAIAKSESA